MFAERHAEKRAKGDNYKVVVVVGRPCKAAGDVTRECSIGFMSAIATENVEM